MWSNLIMTSLVMMKFYSIPCQYMVIESRDEVGSSEGEVSGALLGNEPTTIPDSFELLKDPDWFIARTQDSICLV